MNEKYSQELSHFEQQSTITPTKQPWAIIIGALLALVALIVINALAPTQAVQKGRDAEAKAETEGTAPSAPAASSKEDLDI